MNRIVREALIYYRDVRSEEGARYLARRDNVLTTPKQKEIALELARKAYEDCFDAHESLKTRSPNPCTSLTRDCVSKW